MKTQRDVNTCLPLRRHVGALTSAALFLVSLLGMPLLPLTLCAQNSAIANEQRGLIFQTGTFAERIKRLPKLGNAYTNSLGMKFVSMPDSEVMFCIWETRVQDYRAYAEANAGVDESWKNPGFAQGDTHPVVSVSWNDASAFCAWLSRKEGKTYRLPTDAEWSVAVGLSENSGGTPKDKDCKIRDVYPWGTSWPPPNGAGNFDSSLNVDNNGNTSPVGSFSANRYGLYDMGGNVWEWCEDWYDVDQKYRVLRGASWSGNFPGTLLSSHRNCFTPGFRLNYVGFRVVLVGASSP